MKIPLMAILAAILSFFFSAQAAETNATSLREHLPFDQGWKFHLGDDWPSVIDLHKSGMSYGPAREKFDDSLWRMVDLPHDWAVELPFDERSDRGHGFKPVGPSFQQNSVGWYRKEFTVPASDLGKRISLQFDGVYRDANVFVNGWHMNHHESGYYPFRVDITDVVNYGGKNTVSVSVDATKFEGWFYEGAGIYRHVWLDKTDPVSVAPDGVFVTAGFAGGGHAVPKGPAAISASVTVTNAGTNRASVTVSADVAQHAGGPQTHLSSGEGVIGAGESRTFTLTGALSDPKLWSPESPELYTLSTSVRVDGRVTDRSDTTFGIRTVAFDKDLGFLLNGKPYPLHGTCNHQDHAGVGAALPDALQEFRISKLREFGNAYRTSHNPPTPELLDACDRLGMIVMDENRLLGSGGQNLDLLRTLVLRDRNHPSVCIWSLCNEEHRQPEEVAGRIGSSMQRLVKQLDPTRPVTAAEDTIAQTGLMPALEVRGWNYQVGPGIDAYRAKHPDQPHVGTEQASTVTTRGEYATNKAEGFVPAYDSQGHETAEKWTTFFAERPWLSGGFVWTGFDYRGEPTPYSWPCVSSHFGVLDTCGFPKDNWWFYRAWWGKDPVLHLLPHWNWHGKEGQEIRVDALSNCREVELFLNGTSLGRKEMKPNSKLSWTVKYAPGTLSAKGYDASGKMVSETRVETTGAPAALRLEAWKPGLKAKAGEADVVSVSAVDDKGRVVPTSMNRVSFTISGPARILGVGNGNPSCHEPDQVISPPSFRSVPITGWHCKEMALPPKPTDRRGNYDAVLGKFLAPLNDLAWPTSPVPEGKSGVCSATLTLSASDLKSPLLLRLEGFSGPHAFVNGSEIERAVRGKRPAPIGDCYPEGGGTVYRIPAALVHEGKNTLLVAVESGAPHPKASLESVGEPVPAQWSRSLFNGYAQVILGSTGQPGEVTLTATAEGLRPASVTIRAAADPVAP